MPEANVHERGVRPVHLTKATLGLIVVGLSAVWALSWTQSDRSCSCVPPLTTAASVDCPPEQGIWKTAYDGRPRLLDLGAGGCIPCKMMSPVLEELKTEYEGRLDVVFVDVSKNPEAAQQYGVHSIPTQIFFDGLGKELYRHQGFLAKRDILDKWEHLGIDLAGITPGK